MPNLFSRQTRPFEVVTSVRLNKWEDVQRLPEIFDAWVFRGQRDHKWFLRTTLERACTRLRPGVTIAEVERAVLRKFQERAAEYYQECPGPDELLEWLSLLQHHGGPTRLLDFTESANIAAFFALADAEGDSAIWGVNTIRTMASQVIRYLGANPGSDAYTMPTFSDVFYGRFPWKGYGADIRHPRRTGRIAYQRGMFVYSFNMEHSLEENLYGMHGVDAEQCRANIRGGYHTGLDAHPQVIARLKELRVIKFILPQSLRREGLRELRKMGIDYSGLFRDLDGFARSMGHEVYDLTADPE